MGLNKWMLVAGLLSPAIAFSAPGLETEQGAAMKRAAAAELRVEILTPTQGQLITGDERRVLVDGGASSFGGIRQLDMVFVLDSSKSLMKTDPRNFLARGTVGLIQNLSPKSDIQVGVVSFDDNADLLQPMTTDRFGGTDIADGISAALEELAANARPNSTRVIMLFTDGRSSERKAQRATEAARAQGVVVHTMQLGEDEKGEAILRNIANGTEGSFVQVTDPALLPQAFLDLKTTGVESVALQVNGGEPVPARLAGGSFSAEVMLQPGENRIVAIATGLHGDTAVSEISVTSGPPNCASFEVQALRDGQPTASIDDRAVQIVVDASRSMWGRMEGEPKMTIAKQTLLDVSQGFGGDSKLALRAYGNTSSSELRDCRDSELLVDFSEHNGEQIRQAIQELRPTGQTPIAYALKQAGYDFEGLEGEKAVVLVTDGIESCGGEPAYEAGALNRQGIAIHVIGFGMGNAADEDTASLDAIAQAADGRFVLAGSSEELKQALADSVGTPFRVFDGLRVVATGVLGSSQPILLPEGDYLVELESSPPRELEVSLVPGERLTLTLEKDADQVAERQQRRTLGYTPCPVGGAVPAEFVEESPMSTTEDRVVYEDIPREW